MKRPPKATHSTEIRRMNDERYRHLVENAADIIYETDPDGNFTFFNPTAVELTGYSEAEIMGMHFLKLVHPDFRDSAMQFYRSQREQKARSTYYEFPVLAKDGRVVWLGQHVQSVETGGRIEKFFAVARDITSRRHLEETLAERESTIRALLDSASQAVFAVDRDGHISFANPIAEEMFGYQRNELDHLKIEALLPVEIGAAHVAHRKDFFAKPHARPMGFGLELSARRKDGTEFPVEVSLNCIETRDGLLAVSFVSDISERKRRLGAIQEQEKLRALADGLLRGQEEERRRIARELHDDVNQQLAMLAVELGKLVRGTEDADSVREALARLQGRATALSNDVRNMSHRLHPTDLEYLGLDLALRSHGRRFEESNGIRVEFVVRNQTDSLPSDVSVGLYRVAQEALQNVAKHSGAKEVVVKLEGLDDGVKLSVSDKGVGFKFGQVKGKAGLGLVSMEERVRLLGGRLLIDSTPDEGTELEVYVPLPREES